MVTPQNDSWNELNSLTQLQFSLDIIQDTHNCNSTKMLPFHHRQVTLKMSF